ncbi:hypothetical protein HB662_10190 [Roseomonas frigidaquae]|uniref:Toprim domain-containing protein n=1 Tax=Falsiroseomonas frigidaquae TaxID=487318 RepID=A0ABX1EYM7_9PROT|nr:toprim domain-containing protein [Falsiroseomonas frigidaquae]NKE45149.1 hypothetical protein [Falsiroseomonas frigidaquae]
MTGQPNASAVAVMLAERMPDLVSDVIGEPSQRGREEWRFRRKGSLAVVVAGPKRGAWQDHEAGEGGDALALVAHARREPMGAAYGWALAWLGIARSGEPRPTPRPVPAPPESPREASPSTTLDLARRIWGEAVVAAGTPVETYLAARGLALPDGAPLRFHHRAWRNAAFGPAGPAMVALMTDAETGEPCGAHVTYLRPDGGGKAAGERVKVMLGRVGCIRLTPDPEVTMGLGLAEGIETSISVMQGFGWRPIWAATSAGAIARFPLLRGLDALTVFADADDSGLAAARRCAERWASAGREAHIAAPPSGDFNDVLNRKRAA